MGKPKAQGLALLYGDAEPGLRETDVLSGGKPLSAVAVPAVADLNVYCINLKRSPRRRAYMEQQAEREGVVVTFVEAIDGTELDLAQIAEYNSAERRARFGWDLAATEVATALSHRKALAAIRDAGHDRAVVLEDDAEILPGFKDVVSALYRRDDLDFDIVRLCGARNRSGRLVTLLDATHSLERPYRPMCGLQAYMVNAASIDRVIRSFIPITMQIDVALDRFWENDLKILSVRPFVALPSHAFDSDVAATGDQWRQERKLFRLNLRARRALDHIKRTRYILRSF